MALSNHERVGKELEAKHGKYWVTTVTSGWPRDLDWGAGDVPNLDAAVLLRMMWDQWNLVFSRTLGFTERSIVSELRETRNKWAHQSAFSSDDAYRALDSTARLLTAISAPQADEVEKMKMELLRVRFDEQVRSERRKGAGTAIESTATGALKPWREVVTPHRDVASGRYQQAEFAADLWQVHLGEGTEEYRNPVEFFRRTYLTESLKRLLVNAVQRLTGQGGDPVVQLQTNFGGGKTHSMLTLYHLFAGSGSLGVAPRELAGVDAVLADAGAPIAFPSVRRVVLVGNKISPGNPTVKADGTVVKTLWGELAWQLGFAAGGVKEARAAYEQVRGDDERATNPGDTLRTLFNHYGPCLILIDEWVAYARQLHDQGDLPGGNFETQFTFAQALTESAKLAQKCLLVISLPASDTAGSPHTRADDAEVGGQRGREALDRLRNVVGRIESSWRPASAEEGFEIVRRRLFEPLADPAQFRDRDVVARAFADLYRTQAQEFPPECRDSGYEQRLKAAYPIHPEVFDRLYNDWSTLVKFQRTRGVLRLMAAVIHSLWEKGDRNPLIQPGNLPIDDPRVQFELTRYLSDNWAPIIEKDVDGAHSLPVMLDGEAPNLGKFAACRRVARTIYLGSAPLTTVANRGMEDRRVKLGCLMPGETPAVFGDALRRLAGAATYLYQDGARYWYATQPTVTKLAEDRAEQLRRDPDRVFQEMERRLRKDLERKGEFSRIHPLPATSADVPDDLDARLVVLRPDYPYSKEATSRAEEAARQLLSSRGNAPRLYQNTLVFLAADKNRLQDLDEAVRRYLAWASILDEKELLDLSPHQVRQAETQKDSADGTATARLPECYQWLLVPGQPTPQSPLAWSALRLSGQDALAVRASKKVINEERLLTQFGATMLRLEMDRIPLWRGDDVPIRQLMEDFARYLYLPRLRESGVLLDAIERGLGLLTWAQDGFAYADSYDKAARRYGGLQSGQRMTITASDSGLLVRPAVAQRQLAEESAASAPVVVRTPSGVPQASQAPEADGAIVSPTPPLAAVVKPPPRRYYGSVTLDPQRVGRDASRIAEEVIAHLAGLVGARVTVTLDIAVNTSEGVPDNVVSIVSENSRTLKFADFGFERE
jgi:predicted AAA+ superfamily ATPase